MIRLLPNRKPRKRAYSQRTPAEGRAVPIRTIWSEWGTILFAFAVLVAAITREPKRDEDLAVDIDLPVSDREIQAKFDFTSVNLQATKEAQDAAVAKVPDYYRVDSGRVEGQLETLRQRIAWFESHYDEVRSIVLNALRDSTSDQSTEEVVGRAVNTYAAQLKEEAPWESMPDTSALALWLMPDLDALPARQFIPVEREAETAGRPVETLVPADPPPFDFTYGLVLSQVAQESLEFVLNQGIRESELPPGASTQRVVILNNKPSTDTQAASEILISEVPSPVQAAEALSTRLQDTAKRAAIETAEPSEWAKLHDAALALVQPLVMSTITYDLVYTAGARERTREAVEPVPREILAGEIIQEQHKRWTPQSRADVSAYLSILKDEKRPGQRVLASAAAHAIFVLLALLCLNRSVHIKGWHASEQARTHFNAALLIMAAMLIVGRIVSYFEPSGFLIPIAAAGILYAILVGVRLAAMVSFLTAVLVSIQYGYDWRLLLVGSAMSLAGVFSIFRVRRRSDMAAASLKATLVGVLTIIAISLATDSLLSDASFRRLMLIALNGGICLLAVPGVLSPLERLFNITTDIQLLEYSDLNNELLSQLALKAPGTYAHSLMLGQLAEAAADAIGANGLLARVCAYYHDIGKMRRSEYFTENQTGQNIHDALSPRLSARAIAAHVVQGAEMAREYRLPKPIIDGILEHHGTCLIGYFYKQALENQKHGDVREKDFRYPGPKPQRPETAILMICDASESGVRSIKNPNEERVREFIDGIVAARSADGQFDECDLTLKQLNIIVDVVTHRMLSSMHARIAYPSAKREEAEDNIIPLTGGTAQ